jgi:pullulanase/glycogen debranching enzyme
MTARTGDIWHAYVPGIGAGQRYGYRVDGPWNPARGVVGQRGQAAAGPVVEGHRRRLGAGAVGGHARARRSMCSKRS